MSRLSLGLIYPPLVLYILHGIGVFPLLAIISQLEFMWKLEQESGSSFQWEVPTRPRDVYTFQYESDLAMHQRHGNLEAKFSTDTIEKLKEMANYCITSGNVELAIRVLKQTLELQIQSDTLGPEDAETVATLDILAGQYVVLEKYDQGLALYWRVYRIQEKENALGTTHYLNTITTLQKLAYVYHLKGNYEKAVGFFKVVYKHRNQLLGPDHPETMETLFLRANSLCKSEEVKSVKNSKVFETALKYYEKVYSVVGNGGQENDITVAVQFERVKILLISKRPTEAVPILRKLLKVTEERQQPELYKSAEGLLGLTLNYLGRAQEAHQLFKKARQKESEIPEYDSDSDLKITDRTDSKFPREIENQITAVLNLAKVLMAEKSYEKALQKLEELYSIVEHDEPEQTGDVLQSLMKVYAALGNFTRAFDTSIQLFKMTQKQLHLTPEGSFLSKNELMVDAWKNVFMFYVKAAEESPEEDEQVFSPKLKEILEVLVNTLELPIELELKGGDQENPSVLKTLVIAASFADKLQVALSAASKLIPILQRQRDKEPKPRATELEQINTDIHTFQQMLDKNESFGREKNEEIRIYIHEHEM